MKPSLESSIIEPSDLMIDGINTSQNIPMTRHDLGQFFTPVHVADFMASLFLLKESDIELLDAGAGAGALTEAVVRRLCARDVKPKRITVNAFELDTNVLPALRNTMNKCRLESEIAGIQFSLSLRNEDFIAAAASSLRADLLSTHLPSFNLAIVNPPYRKLHSNSGARRWLRSIGVETSNFYSAFVTLILRSLAKGGELVAITPRSFCNGPYFNSFRTELLNTSAIHRLHLFDSRSAAFGKDNVLQENVIVHAIKDERQPENIVLSASTGGVDSVIREQFTLYEDVVLPSDQEHFIHIGIVETDAHTKSAMGKLQGTLGELGLTVSTGRVVDFRARIHLRNEPANDTVPLIYPSHFKNGVIVWPKKQSRKPNALAIHDNTRELLVPRGAYVLVKRFSSKEEKRRIVASVYDPTEVSAEWIAFENHLNYFHIDGGGLPIILAKGLSAFLNSTAVDSYFRAFSGHTQVNATDLRKLRYPDRIALERLGNSIKFPISQGDLDELLEKELF